MNKEKKIVEIFPNKEREGRRKSWQNKQRCEIAIKFDINDINLSPFQNKIKNGFIQYAWWVRD